MSDEVKAQAGRFTFTKIAVSDLEVSVRFYKEVFGLKESARMEGQIKDETVQEIILEGEKPEDPSLVLVRYSGREGVEADDGVLGFITSDLYGLVERIRQAGGRVAHEPREAESAGVLVIYVDDPDGHQLELVQPLAR
ncbi:MAG: VOC family protein [Deltaproteobacteria bacterium]|jgi:lactoylglutathione lyase|nr:VOC family protein [Deltaproteobacteria bacterium]MBW2496989.1 VOC family protein [Deltaproteobacteria bacterium]